MRKMLFLFSLFLSVSTAEAAYLDLAWDLNQEPDLAGYRVYHVENWLSRVLGTQSFKSKY